MSPNQKAHFYFPAWNNCCRANAWKVQGGFATVDEARLSDESRKILAFARQRAMMRDGAVLLEAQPVRLDDLRHAAHILALGRDKSSDKLTNAEVDRVVCLFKLLADPDDLGARLAWDAYQRGEDPGETKRLEYFIRQTPEAYVRHISADKFGTREWENLTQIQKRDLAKTLSQRNRTKQARPESTMKHNGTTEPAAAPARPAAGQYTLKPHLTFEKKASGAATT